MLQTLGRICFGDRRQRFQRTGGIRYPNAQTGGGGGVLQAQLAQIGGELGTTLVALGGILGHSAGDHGIKRARKFEVKCGGGHGITIDHLVADGRGTVAMKRRVAGNHGVENHAEGKKIGAAIRAFTHQLFGGHVGGRSQDAAGNGEVSHIQFGNAKIGNLGMTVFGEQNVRGLNVAVNDTLGMSIVEGFGKFFG